MLDFLNTIGGLPGLGLLLAGSGFAYAQFKQGGTRAKDEVIATYKEQAVAEKERASRLAEEKTVLINSHQIQINELNNKMGKLQGAYEQSEKRNKEFLEIFQGKNPEQTEFMKYLTAVAADSAKFMLEGREYMRGTTEILNDIKTFMAVMNAEIAKGNMFNKQVMEDTKHGEGEVLRKKV